MARAATALDETADGLLEAALLGVDWAEPMEAFAAAAGADGATLVRHDPTDRAAPALRSGCLLATRGIAGIAGRYLRGEAPPDPRLARVSPRLTEGFLADHDRFRPVEIALDPFYQEFLRPEGFHWHGCARLTGGEGTPQIYLSLKRALDRGHYSRSDIAALDRTLPKLRLAASLAEAVFAAEAGARGRALAERGEALFEIDSQGRARPANAAAEGPGALRLRSGRLETDQPSDQSALDAALLHALAPAARPACAVLASTMEDARIIVRTIPASGPSREIFRGVAAFALVRILAPPAAPAEDLVLDLREAFDLTTAEARVGAMVGLGLAPAEASRRLGVAPGTARNYLKAVFAKTGTGRQAELAALVAAMVR